MAVNESHADLIHVWDRGVEYVAIPLALAGPVARCIQRELTRVAANAGTSVPTQVPLWALALQLEIECRLTAGTEAGTSLDGDAREPRLSTHDAAKQLGISRRAVTKAAAQKRLQGEQVGVGAFWTFRQADIDDFSQRRTSA